MRITKVLISLAPFVSHAVFLHHVIVVHVCVPVELTFGSCLPQLSERP